jgi:hypothetical protein
MDTFEGRDFEPLSLHKYTYASSNPVDNADPSGHETTTAGQLGAIIVLGVLATIGALIATSVISDITTTIERDTDFSYLFRGDDYYAGGPVGFVLDSEEAKAADIQTPWEHVGKESNESSRFTSFSTTKKGASTFGSRIYKVPVLNVHYLMSTQQIKLYYPETVEAMMRSHPSKSVWKNAKNAPATMRRNDEVLVEGQIPGSLMLPVK